MRNSKFTLSLILFSFFTFLLNAQDVDYQVRVSSLSSVEGGIFGACYEPGLNEYRYNVWARDDVNTTETGYTCFMCDESGDDCFLSPAEIIRTENASTATAITIRFEAWEEDTGGDCTYDESFFDDDDCHCEPNDIATIAFLDGAEGVWETYGPYNCGSHSVVVEIIYTVNPLPVELIDFAGFAERDHNYLEWATASEINTDYFEIQRSSNGKDWKPLEQETARGFSEIMEFYEFKDEDPLSDAFYRLYIVDFDGSSEYSNVIFIDNEFITKDLPTVSIYPNPNQGRFKIEMGAQDKSTNLKVNIMDALGRVLRTSDHQKRGKEELTLDMDLSGEVDGFYFIVVQDDFGNVFSERLIKGGPVRP